MSLLQALQNTYIVTDISISNCKVQPIHVYVDLVIDFSQVMEGSRDSLNSDSAENLATFHPYPRLPAELKLEVWKYAFEEWSNGVHRFRLFVDPARPTRLTYEPCNKEVDDVSVWRQRVGMASLDSFAFDEFRRFKATATLLHRNDTLGRKIPGRALANPKTDLVTFRFDYGETIASLVMLDPLETSEVFKGITRIGVELEFFNRGFGRNKAYKPFYCICPDGHLAGSTSKDYCFQQMFRFIRFFPDLEEFYIICPITKTNLRKDWIKFFPRKLERLVPKRGKTAITQASLDVYRQLQKIAQEEGLEEFRNRAGAYCEFPWGYASTFLHLGWHVEWHLLSLRDVWANGQQMLDSNQAKIDFKFLAWSDLRGVTVGQGGPALRAEDHGSKI
ncbi:hypothetical protein RRF57_005896 [Xylaria bambusicola]|uniref:Uncharacterized protein n=1 Tax=Xylaria bambusicola TaxID=326684 RepID=A0AAN7UPB9_9PEZI